MEKWFIALLDGTLKSVTYLRSGGCVMIPLVGISLWMWVIIFKKLLEFRVYRKEEIPAKKYFCLLSRGTTIAKGWQGKIIEAFLRKRVFELEADRKLLQSLVMRQRLIMENNIKTILVLASVAPLLGLLGTVTGMITTFDVISIFGTGNPKALASGISEALITTQAGLVVAIPGLFMGNSLNRQVERFQDRMERFILNIVSMLEIEDRMP